MYKGIFWCRLVFFDDDMCYPEVMSVKAKCDLTGAPLEEVEFSSKSGRAYAVYNKVNTSAVVYSGSSELLYILSDDKDERLLCRLPSRLLAPGELALFRCAVPDTARENLSRISSRAGMLSQPCLRMRR